MKTKKDIYGSIDPCPFCGGTDAFTRESVSGKHYAYCGQCGSTGSQQETIDDAIDAWNARVVDHSNVNLLIEDNHKKTKRNDILWLDLLEARKLLVSKEKENMALAKQIRKLKNQKGE